MSRRDRAGWDAMTVEELRAESARLAASSARYARYAGCALALASACAVAALAILLAGWLA